MRSLARKSTFLFGSLHEKGRGSEEKEITFWEREIPAFFPAEARKNRAEGLAVREEGLRPLVKLLSRVPEVNSIFHQLRSSRARQAQATSFPLPTRFEIEVFVPTFLVFKQCLFTADFRGRRSLSVPNRFIRFRG